MPSSIRRSSALAVAVLVCASIVAGCGVEPEIGGERGGTTTSSVPPAFVPITGGRSEDGTPEPPPIHAVFSVVVRQAQSWEPYAGPELNGLDTEATAAIASRLRQMNEVLVSAGVTASFELAYGPAAALCSTDPELLDQLQAAGHRIALNARTNGEVLRATEALAACGHVASTASGLAAMSDPAGPEAPSAETLTDSMSVLSVVDIRQVVGSVSRLCTDLGLARATHGYGTGSFTAPWRSGWTVGNPCGDHPAGRIVVIDQAVLGPVEGANRIDAGSFSILTNRTSQMLAYALDLRYREAGDLPAPGVITWGLALRLDDLIEADPIADPDAADPQESDAPPIDARTAPLSAASLEALAAWFETLRPSIEKARFRWMLPDEVAELLRPA